MPDELDSRISNFLERLELHKGRRRGEAVTKSNFIEPMLMALGWDVFNFNDIEKEYGVFGGGSVDYALKISGAPKLFIEAKKLDESLDKPQWITQLNNYVAGTGGVKWGILTNGNEYRLYKSNEVELHPPDRIVFKVSIEDCRCSEKRAFFIEMIKHLAKDKMASGCFDRWASDLFLENRIRKVMCNPSNDFLSAVKNAIRTSATSDDQIKTAMESVLKGYVIKIVDETEPYGENWHKERCSPETWKWLLQIIKIVEETVEAEGPNWKPKYYVSYKIDDMNWFTINTHKKNLLLSFAVSTKSFFVEKIADRLGIVVFDKEASFGERINLPSSVAIENVNPKKDRIALRIKDNFELEQDEFRKLLQETCKAFKTIRR